MRKVFATSRRSELKGATRTYARGFDFSDSLALRLAALRLSRAGEPTACNALWKSEAVKAK